MTLGGREDHFKICEKHLDRVSRTFALNIRVLRGDAYRALLVAYLLCRIADTIEDEPSLPAAEKINHLVAYESLFPLAPDWSDRVNRFTAALPIEGTSPDLDLLRDTPLVFSEFSRLPGPMQLIISERVREMARGMASFQEKVSGDGVVMLEDRDELEHYCYYVAGTVGLMITTLFFGDGVRVSRETRERLRSRSVAFGLGLQMTNIAKDFMGDRDRGWCYVPRSFFEDCGVDPATEEFSDDQQGRVVVLNRVIDLAIANLDEAIIYVQSIPRRFVRYRLFCLWPLLMAVETLALIRRDQDRLVRGIPLKIERKDVRRIIRNSSCVVFSNRLVRSLYEGARSAARVSLRE